MTDKDSKKKYKPSVFISYTHTDRDKVLPIASFLGRLGLQVWMDIKDLVAGQSIIQEISLAISKADMYVVCISPQSLQSQWVMHELNTALTLETTQGNPKVLPFLIEKCELPCTSSAIMAHSGGRFRYT